jgi:CP family cyanate transporter-like MFS transporter
VSDRATLDRTQVAVAAVAMVAVAANLRPAVASVGPVLPDIRADLGLSAAAAAALTAAPVLCFGAVAGAGPWLARRVGMRRAVAVLTAVIMTGLLARVAAGTAMLFAGTVLASAAIAAANVLLPSLIKDDFGHRTGLMMGLYTTALTGSAAAAAGLTVPLGRVVGHGWRGALGLWAGLAAVALALWLPRLRNAPRHTRVRRPAPGRLRHSSVAWMVTVFFGLQSLSFYAVLNWLPTLYRDNGYSAAAAGGLLSLSALVQVPVALILPSVATRMHHQGLLVAGSATLTAFGLVGIVVAPTAAPVVWVVALGIGQGSAFPIALTLLVLRTRSPVTTTQLSAMAQSFGYLIAAAGPALVGALHEASGGWRLPFGVLVVLLVPQTIAGLRAAAPGYVDAGASAFTRRSTIEDKATQKGSSP